MTTRIVGIDILKVFAVLFVLNSHMDMCYEKYAALATGGAIGDALFFFCSGFTLFLGTKTDFFNWYRRRISRIYPAVLVVALFACVYAGAKDDIVSIVTFDRYWFLKAILIYYALLFPIKEYLQNHLRACFLACAGVVVALYFLVFREAQSGLIYGGGYTEKSCFSFSCFKARLSGSPRGNTNTGIGTRACCFSA